MNKSEKNNTLKKMDLSIVILNYNTGDFLRSCIDSIYKSVTKISFRVIVVDNNSSDNSLDLISAYNSKIRIIKNKNNLGFAKGNNQAVPFCKSSYVLFLNPDTQLESSTLDELYHYMQDNLDVGVATSKLVLANGKLDEASHRGFPTPLNSLFFFSGLSKLFPTTPFFSGYTRSWQYNNSLAHEVDAISGAFFFVRYSVGKLANWWDEDYYWYGEDLEFCYRIRELGYKVMFLPYVKTLHYRGVSSGIKKHSAAVSQADRSTKIQSAKASTRAMKIFYQKHYLKKYPFIVNFVVIFAINILEKIRISKV